MRWREEETKGREQNFTHQYPAGSVEKNPPSNAGNTRDMGSFPGSRRCLWRRKWQPSPDSYLRNPMDRGAWQAAVHGIAKESDATHDLVINNNNNNMVL